MPIANHCTKFYCVGKEMNPHNIFGFHFLCRLNSCRKEEIYVCM